MAPNTIKDPSNLGNVLLDMGVISMDKLKAAVLQQMHERGETHLGEVLRHMGAISDIDLEAALKVQACLRDGNILGAHLEVLDFQTKRIDRSVTRQEAVVAAGNAVLDRAGLCAGCENRGSACANCVRMPRH